MTQPAAGPATLELTKLQLSLGSATDDAFIENVVKAVNVIVRKLPKAQLTGLAEEPWPDDVVQGANLLASRLVKRRNSPAGVEAMTAQGAVFVPRNDPDVALLLGLGSYAKPVVG